MKRPMDKPPSTKVERHCPLCQRQLAQTLADLNIRDFDGVELATRIQPVACDACGFVYNELPFGQDALDQFYANDSLYSATVGVGSGGTGPLDQLRYEHMFARIAPFLRHENPHIVDVGCAKGGFLAHLKSRGYTRLTGVDLSPVCVEHIRETHQCAAFVGGAATLALPGTAPDMMLYSHVLEHLFDPLAALRKAARTLSPDGRIYIEVPDAQGYAQDPVFDCYWLSQREHINHFDQSSLIDMCARAGLRTIEAGSNMLALSTGTPTPVIHVVVELAHNPAATVSQSRLTPSLAASMRAYVAQERSRLAKRNALLQGLIASQRTTYVWGIGLEFFYLFSQSMLARCNIDKLVDNNPAKQALTVDSLPIVSSEAVSSLREDSAVVITSALHHADISRCLRELNYPGATINLARL